jgi:hypothetical protein
MLSARERPVPFANRSYLLIFVDLCPLEPLMDDE